MIQPELKWNNPGPCSIKQTMNSNYAINVIYHGNTGPHSSANQKQGFYGSYY